MTFRVISQDIEDTLNPRRFRVFLVSGQVAAELSRAHQHRDVLLSVLELVQDKS